MKPLLNASFSAVTHRNWVRTTARPWAGLIARCAGPVEPLRQLLFLPGAADVIRTASWRGITLAGPAADALQRRPNPCVGSRGTARGQHPGLLPGPLSTLTPMGTSSLGRPPVRPSKLTALVALRVWTKRSTER